MMDVQLDNKDINTKRQKVSQTLLYFFFYVKFTIYYNDNSR